MYVTSAGLKTFRLRQLDLTQEELARRLDLHRNTLIRYERKRGNVPRWLEFAVRYLVGR